MKIPFYCGCIILATVFSSCKKKEDDQCKVLNYMSFKAPASVMEREDLHLIPVNAADGTNTYFYWGFPNMKSYSYLYGDLVEVDNNGEQIIKNVDARDEGTYTFMVRSGECGTFEFEREIKVIPLPCPCFDELPENTVEVYDPVTGVRETLSGSVENLDLFGQGFYFRFRMPMFTYTMLFDFDYKPLSSGTFYLKNYQPVINESDNNPDIYRYAFMDFTTPTSNSHRLQTKTEDVHVKREGNKMTLTFCNVGFAINGTYDVKKVSGKIVFNL